MKILLITKYFPPKYGARSLQIGKVHSALKKMNLEVEVIAGKENRKNDLEPKNDLNINYIEYPKEKVRHGKIAKIFNRIFSELEVINPLNKWVEDTYKKALLVSEKFQPDIIMSSSTPFESHIAGLKIKRYLSIPWVASFSDPWPWSINPPPYNTYEMPVVNSLQMKYLYTVLNECNAIHMTNKQGLNLLESKTKINIKNKCFAIPHIGTYVPKNTNRDGNGWLTHTGFLSRARVSIPLLKAIKNTVSKYPNLLKGLLLVGTICPEFKEQVQKLGMEKNIKYIPAISQDEAMEIAAQSKALLVIESKMETSPFLPSKFADYAQVGRPIIAITPKNSPIRDYLNVFGGGYAVDHHEVEIERLLKNIFDSNDVSRPNNNELSLQFSSNTVGRKYEEMFHKMKKIKFIN